MPTKQPAGIAAVAAEAGVSVSTVSQVLGGNRPVSAATRVKVEAAIERLGYTPHPGARSMRSRRTESVALIVPDLTNPFYPLVAAGMQEVLMPEGYLLSVSDAALPSANIGQVLAHVLGRRVDGIALGAYGLSDADLARLAGSGTPVVTFGRDAVIPGSDIVESDDEGGFAKVTGHLLASGRRRIAFIGGEPGALPNELRLQGWRAVLGNADGDAEPVALTAFTLDGGREGVDRLLSGPWRPDAIVCANDLIAIGAIRRLRELGLRVPQDVAVTGYDDIEAAALVSPGLTTVENPAREIGRTAAKLLLARFTEGEVHVTQRITLSNRLVIRESSAATIGDREER